MSKTTGITTARSIRPQPQAPRPYHFPRFERRRLSNGLQIVVAPVRKLPVVTVVAMIDAGAVSDMAGCEGVAQLTAELLLEGTLTSTGAELAERFERLGAAVDASVDWDTALVTLTVLTEHLRSALPLLGEVLRAPSFPEREVERLKAERLAELLKLRTEPRGLADEMFARFLYEPSSRYARPEGGTEASVGSVRGDDVRRFYETRYRPAGVTLIMAGDVGPDDAERMVRDTFGDWSGAAAAAATTSDRPARAQRALHLVSKPEAAQAELRIGNVGLPRHHPDYYATVVMNAVLGGLFSSRINLNLREVHGYTYGAFSHLDWRRQAGPFVVSTAVQSDVVALAAGEVVAEIDRIRAATIETEELSLATNYLDGVFPIRYETTDAIAGALATLILYGQPDDFYDTYRARVRAVTTEDVMRVARAHLHPEALQMVVVGDIGILRPQLESLRFGTPAAYDAQGQPLGAGS